MKTHLGLVTLTATRYRFKIFKHPVRVRRDLSSFLFQEGETQIMVC